MSWEERYKMKDTPWDKGRAAPPLVDLLAEKVEVFGDGTVLVPGCGRGHDARLISTTIPSAKVIAVDISQTALKEAAELDQSGRVHYVEADFLLASSESFPGVSSIFEHTCFCAIDPTLRSTYAEACARIIPPGGHWIAIAFLTPREIDDPLMGPPFQTSEQEITELFGRDFVLQESYVPQNTYKGRQGKELVMIWRRK